MSNFTTTLINDSVASSRDLSFSTYNLKEIQTPEKRIRLIEYFKSK